MRLTGVPADSADWMDVDWDAVSTCYSALAAAALADDSLDGWLAEWSRLESVLSEAASLAMIGYTTDTADQAKESRHLRFNAEIMPRAHEASVGLVRRLLDSGLSRPGLGTMLRRFRTSSEIFRAENVPLFAALEELGAEYQRITGGMSAEWEGKALPLPQLQPFLKSKDRATRKRAFLRLAQPYIDQREPLARIFDSVLQRCRAIAENAGYRDFLQFVFPAKYRFDYGPEDCARLRDSIERSVVPAVERAMAVRRVRLGLDTLRPWDIQVDPWELEPARPFASGAELAERAGRAFRAVDPAFGAMFDIMQQEELLDLDSRRGKAPGGYCDTLHLRGRPFIFMNAAGIPEDVITLLHEAGHAFHAYESHAQPLIWQRHPTSEAAELASMSMELLAMPYLAEPAGFYDASAARRAELEHLEDILIGLAHVASVDAFQAWAHTSADAMDWSARDATWLALRARFAPGVDWSGYEAQHTARWYRQLHIFLYPFYYIEYAIAQIGALQVWRNSLDDPAQAARDYRAALAVGATRSLPEIYQAAGVRLTFDAGDLVGLVALIEDRMEELQGSLAGTS